jgi:hypothetical protein
MMKKLRRRVRPAAPKCLPPLSRPLLPRLFARLSLPTATDRFPFTSPHLLLRPSPLIRPRCPPRHAIDDAPPPPPRLTPRRRRAAARQPRWRGQARSVVCVLFVCCAQPRHRTDEQSQHPHRRPPAGLQLSWSTVRAHRRLHQLGHLPPAATRNKKGTRRQCASVRSEGIIAQGAARCTAQWWSLAVSAGNTVRQELKHLHQQQLAAGRSGAVHGCRAIRRSEQAPYVKIQ